MHTCYSNSDIYPLIINRETTLENTLGIICPKLTPKESIINKASLTFRHLPHLLQPREKVSLLVDMVKGIDKDLQNQGITLCCDDLIPIVSQIVMLNLDILPYAEIQLVFDYLENSCNEDAYVATVVLSSLHDCYNNLKRRVRTCKTPEINTIGVSDTRLTISKSCPKLNND